MSAEETATVSQPMHSAVVGKAAVGNRRARDAMQVVVPETPSESETGKPCDESASAAVRAPLKPMKRPCPKHGAAVAGFCPNAPLPRRVAAIKAEQNIKESGSGFSKRSNKIHKSPDAPFPLERTPKRRARNSQLTLHSAHASTAACKQSTADSLCALTGESGVCFEDEVLQRVSFRMSESGAAGVLYELMCFPRYAKQQMRAMLQEDPSVWREYHSCLNNTFAGTPHHPTCRWMVPCLASALDVFPPNHGVVHVADMGCGQATLAKFFYEQRSIVQFWNVDFFAERPGEDYKELNMIQGDMDQTPLGDASMDFAVYTMSASWGALPLSAESREVSRCHKALCTRFKEARRVLRPSTGASSGVLLILEPVTWWPDACPGGPGTPPSCPLRLSRALEQSGFTIKAGNLLTDAGCKEFFLVLAVPNSQPAVGCNE